MFTKFLITAVGALIGTVAGNEITRRVTKRTAFQINLNGLNFGEDEDSKETDDDDSDDVEYQFVCKCDDCIVEEDDEVDECNCHACHSIRQC